MFHQPFISTQQQFLDAWTQSSFDEYFERSYV